MKKLVAFCGALLLGTAFLSAQTISTQHFEGVKITGMRASVIDVELRQGQPTGVKLEMDESLKPIVYCRLDKDGVIEVGVESRTKKNVKAIVTLSRLDLLRVTNQSIVQAFGSFSAADTCNVLVDKRSELHNLDIRADSVRVKSTSGATVTNLRADAPRGLLVHASGGGTLSCDGLFKTAYCEAWTNQGRISNLRLQVDNADVHSVNDGEINDFGITASGKVLLEARSLGRIACSGPSRVADFDVQADWGGVISNFQPEGNQIRLKSWNNSSIEIQKITGTNVETDASYGSRIIGGGLNVIAKGGYEPAQQNSWNNSGWGWNNSGWNWNNWFWGARSNNRNQTDTEFVRITRFENLPIAGIKTNGLFEVVLRQGTQTGARVEIPKRLESYLTFTMGQDQVVNVSLKDVPGGFKLDNLPRIRVEVTVSRPETIAIGGLSFLQVEGELTTTGKTTIRVNDLSKVSNLSLQAQAIDLRCSDLSKAENVRLSASGEIALEVQDLSKITDCTVKATDLSLLAQDMSKISVTGEVKVLRSSRSQDMSKINAAGLRIGQK